MENQKKVELLGIKIANDKTIRLVELDFEKFKESNVIEIIGKNGAGKSTLIKGVKSAVSGAKTLKDKELLELGLTHEIKLHDGDYDVYMGFHVREISKGNNKGELTSENYLYTRDKDGNINNKPVLDGVSKAEDYRKILTTPLSFDMEELYSENQTIVRKRIEQVYAFELNNLGVDGIREEIATARKNLDEKRAERDRENAVMEYFKEQGYSEDALDKLKFTPVDEIEAEIKELEIEKGVLLKNPEEAKEKRLNAIREEGRMVVGKIRKLNEKRQKEYDDWKVLESAYDADSEQKNMVATHISNYLVPDDVMSHFNNGLERWNEIVSSKHEAFVKSEKIEKPVLIPIEDDQIVLYEDFVVPAAYKELMQERSDVGKKYKAEKGKEIDLSQIDTKAIDEKITAKTEEKTNIEAKNKIFKQYSIWKEWIEKRGLYEKAVEKLRKLYAKIDTGVEGLKIDTSEKDESQLWLTYNGIHNPEVFGNKKKEFRRLHTYSASQFCIVGVLMQAALLDKKEKTVRFVVLDNYNMTRESKELLEKVCQEKDVKLLLTRTDDRYDLEKLEMGEVVIDGGELLLN